MIEGDFAYNPMNLRFGALARLNENTDIAVSKYYAIFHCNNKCNDIYMSYYLTTKKMIQYYDRFSEGTLEEKKRVHFSNFLEFKKPFPQKNEQEKIASFLTAVDSKIEKLTRKKELLEEYKKGVMQKLFSREIRFKDENGNDYPDWVELKVGDIANVFDGTHSTPKYVKEGIPFYSVEHITSNNFKDTKYISPEVFEKENRRVKLEKGDVLMTRIGNVGTAKLIDWDVEASFYVSLALYKISKNVVSDFLAVSISAEYFQKEIWKRMIHVAFPQKINLGEISKCTIKVPSEEEQFKISNFVKEIDKKINSVKLKIEKNKYFKKGLLQQMFV